MFLPETFSRLWITDNPLFVSTSTSKSEGETLKLASFISLSKFELTIQRYVYNRSAVYIRILTILHILSQWSLVQQLLRTGHYYSSPLCKNREPNFRVPLPPKAFGALRGRAESGTKNFLALTLTRFITPTCKWYPLLLLPKLDAPFPSSSLPLLSSHRHPHSGPSDSPTQCRLEALSPVFFFPEGG